MVEKKKVRMAFLIILDMVIIMASYTLSCYIRFDVYQFNDYIGTILKYSPITLLVYFIILWSFKMYKRLWKSAGIDEVIHGGLACAFGGITNYIIMEFISVRVPRTITILACILISMGVISLRLSYRVVRRVIQYNDMAKKQGKENVLIVGAGACGQIIITEILREKADKYNITGLIDDNNNKLNTYLKGYRILGNRSNIQDVVIENHVNTIIIAIPSMDAENRKAIVELCNKTKAKVKIIPGVYELLDGKVNLNKMRDVDLKDLLGRPEINLDKDGISEYLSGKTVLVTGAGGSIGSELCRQIASFKPQKLILVDIYENNIYDIQNELSRKIPDLNKEVIIGSVRDKNRIDEIFFKFRPQVVFHAAAHKHVPLMEESPSEAIKNNVGGTFNVTQCADKYKVERFVLISTDKAVNPTNVMGATKRLCEMVVQAMNSSSKTEFVAVRFGNVLGSNGSVIPLFRDQIKEGGPVTLTHKEITRYFMLIPEAAQLVLQAGAYAKGGEIFVLDMGKPVKIYDLAENLIRLSGYEPHKDIKVVVTGLRPGEKLYEELLMSEEGLTQTEHEKIFIGRPGEFEISEVRENVERLLRVSRTWNLEDIKSTLKEIVPTYVEPNHLKNKTIGEPKVEVATTLEFISSLEG